jgi:hypothetical protein
MVLETSVRPEKPAALETATPFAYQIPGIVFSVPGEYAFVITLEDEEIARNRFQVNFVEQIPVESPPQSTIGSEDGS